MARILIVDDEPVNRLLLSAVLAQEDHVLFEADGGLTALELTKEYHPHLIILDLHMPGMSGPAFIKLLRADPDFGDTLIALYTATATDAAMRDFMQLYRINHIVPKPGDPQEIIAAVRAALPRG